MKILIEKGKRVLIPFPFTDLKRSKNRPSYITDKKACRDFKNVIVKADRILIII